MFTIIGADGKQYGPVPADKVQAWIRDGRANLQTKAQRAGEAEWRTLGEFPEFSGAAVPPPQSAATPVAAAAPAAQPAGPAPLPATPGSVDVFECLNLGFQLWKNNFLPLVGATLLILAIQFFIGLIPLLGALSGFFLNGVFYGGLYYYYLGKVRGEPREISDVFAGFTRALVPLMLTSLLQTAMAITLALVFFFPWIGFFIEAIRHPGAHGALPEVSGLMVGVGVVGALVMLYCSLCWIYSFVLVIDRGLGPWAAITTSWRFVTRRWFAVFFVMFFGAILAMLGLIGLIIGVLFTLPLMIAAYIYAYEMLFGPAPAGTQNPG